MYGAFPKLLKAKATILSGNRVWNHVFIGQLFMTTEMCISDATEDYWIVRNKNIRLVLEVQRKMV